MAFPTSPSNDDLHTEFGRTFKYSSASNSWSVATPDAPEDNTPITQGYVDVQSLPLTDVAAGSKAFVQDGNKLFIFTGSGWFEIATINTAPTITAGADATYALNSDGTPTVITLQATDPEGTPIIWGYQVMSGSLEDTTITNEGGVFTITPGTTPATFDLAFTASDGVNIDTSASSFTLMFGPDWSTVSLLHTLDNPNAGTAQPTSDFFGSAVSLNESYCVVGANYEDNDSPERLNDGKAYIFNTTTGQLLYTLHNPNTSPAAYSDEFGKRVIVDGNYAAITGDSQGIGKVFIYDLTNGNLTRTISNPDNATGHGFGNALALIGNYLFVGASGRIYGRGRVYVFDILTGTLINTLGVFPGDPITGFGSDVHSYGDYVIIGGASYNSWSGKIWLYKTDTGDWTDAYLVWTIDNPNSASTTGSDHFGFSVAMNDSYIAISAKGEKDPSDTARTAGRVYVFNLAGTLQYEISNPVTTGYAQFGNSLSLDGNNLLIVDPYINTSVGQAYIYNITSGTLLSTIVNPNAEPTTDRDYLGVHNLGMPGTCSIKGEYAVVGAGNEYASSSVYNSGKAYIFQAA